MDQSTSMHEDPPNDSPGDESNRGSVAWILVFLAAAVIALLAIQLFVPPRGAGSGGQGVGHSLPDLRLEPLTGDSRPLRLNDLAGKVVLLDFWGTWCPPCRAELPHIAALAAKYHDRADFQLLAVSCDQGRDDPQSTRAETQEFLQDNKLDIATYFDADSYTRREAAKVGAFQDAFPTTLVLDRQGVIRGMWIGYEPGSERRIGELVAKLLAEH